MAIVVPDKNDTSELMLIVSEYVESIKTPPLIVRCSGIGGTISPLGNKKYALSLSTGATKCPTSIKDHVPKKYHAEDMDVIPYVGGAEIFSAEDLSPAQQEFIGQQIARQMQLGYKKQLAKNLAKVKEDPEEMKENSEYFKRVFKIPEK